MKRNIVFFQNDVEQACVVKLGKKKISATICECEDSYVLKLIELEHSQAEKENASDIQQINDRTVYLEFINTESVDVFIEWLGNLRFKLIENKNKD